MRSLLLLFLVSVPAISLADSEVAVRGIYYKEKATRVMQPMIDARFETEDDAVLEAHFLIDAITSASVASGASDDAFTETRFEIGAGYTKQWERIRAGVKSKLSSEPDYQSIFSSGRAEMEFAEKNLVVGLGASFGFDTISNAGAQGLVAGPVEGEMRTMMGSASVSQLLSPNMVASVTYDLSRLSGFLENPYRSAITADGLVPERHPPSRLRQAVAGSFRRFAPSIATTFIASYRFYYDDWGILAHTPELRAIKDIGEQASFGVRYRYHRQGAADFFERSYPTSDPTMEPYVTDDVKLSRFDSHTVAAKLTMGLGLFGFSGRLRQARGELVIEYIDQNNRFGNAGVAHVGLVMPL